MERSRSNILILAARLAQILLGLIILIYTIVVSVVGWNPLAVAVIIMFSATSISILGSIGLFAIKRHPDDIKDTRLYLLVLYVDCWAVALCLTVFIVSHSKVWHTYMPELTVIHKCAVIAATSDVLMVGPALFAFLCVFAIVPLIIRTSRLWWKRDLYGMPPAGDADSKPYASSYYASPSIVRAQDLEAADAVASPIPQTNFEALICQAADEIRSITSSRPFTLTETTNATLYPHLMSAGATVRSQTAPS